MLVSLSRNSEILQRILHMHNHCVTNSIYIITTFTTVFQVKLC